MILRLSNSNSSIKVINHISFLLGLVSISSWTYWTYFNLNPETKCQRLHQNPLLMLSIFLFVVSLLKFFTSLFTNEKKLVLHMYLVLMLVLIVTIFAFTVFAIIVTNKGEGMEFGNHKLHHMLDYSRWLQQYVSSPFDWSEIKKCLIDSKICTRMADFLSFERSFSPTEIGCCIKPFYCHMDNKLSAAAAFQKDKYTPFRWDCRLWNDNEDQKCYDCGSCKGGILANIKKEWRDMATLNIFVLILMIVFYPITWCIKSIKRSNH